MQILFINPNLRPGSPTGKFLPVGLASVMTFVKHRGYDYDLLDITLSDFDDEFVDGFIRDHDYDVFLLGSIVTHYTWMKWCVNTIKKYHPKSKVIVGNSVGGSIPKLFLQNSPADVVIIGEGEYSCADTLDYFREGKDLDNVSGIAYRTELGAIKINPDRKAGNIDDLPMVDWNDFDVEKYFNIAGGTPSTFGVENNEKVWRTMPVTTARGCVFKCTFCHYVFWNDPYRHRSAESVLEECGRNIDEFGANYLNFWDDLSFSSVNQAERFVDHILASDLKFTWSAAVRSDLFGNPKIDYGKRLRVAEKFKESGCASVGYSLESANAEILKMMNKKVQSHYFEEQVKLLRKVGITSMTSVVFGYPIETKETMRETFDYCEKLGIYPSVGFLLPLPSTGMYDYALKNGFIKDENIFLDSITERQDICLNMTQMTDNEVIKELKDGCGRLNDSMELGLSEDSFIRTGGYKEHTKLDKLNGIKNHGKTDDLKRNQNDMSFNYNQQTFDVNPDTGPTEGKP